MKHIILDTNVVHLDHFLQGTNITVLVKTMNRMDHCIYMPQVVIDEMVNHYKSDVKELSEKFNTTLKKLPRLYGTKVDINRIDPESLVCVYQEKLLERIKKLGIIRLSYPKIGHEKLVLKELNGVKPFKDSTKGYRDSLIWETVLEFCKRHQRGEVVFMTNNTRDFAKGDNTLHPELLEELDNSGVGQDRLTIITTVADYIRKTIPANIKDTIQIVEALNNDLNFGNIDFKEELLEFLTKGSLNSLFTFNYFEENDVYCPQYYENPEITNIDEPTFNFLSVNEVDENYSLVTCEVTIAVDIDAYVYHGDLPLIDDDKRPYVVNFDWNDHYALVSDSANVKMRFEIMVDCDFNEVLSKEQHIEQVEYESGLVIKGQE